MPEIAFIMGKSASGKDKIYKNLIEDESLKLNTVILYTTRPMRAGETDGVEYFFVNDETAVKMQESGRIVELREYNTVYGVWKYFTADDGQIDLNSGNRYLVIGTLEAYDKFCEFYGKQHIMPIYIPPNMALLTSLMQSSNSPLLLNLLVIPALAIFSSEKSSLSARNLLHISS